MKSTAQSRHISERNRWGGSTAWCACSGVPHTGLRERTDLMRRPQRLDLLPVHRPVAEELEVNGEHRAPGVNGTGVGPDERGVDGVAARAGGLAARPELAALAQPGRGPLGPQIGERVPLGRDVLGSRI